MTKREPGATKTENLRARVETELAERVARAAAAEDRSVSSYVRLALLDRLSAADVNFSKQVGG